jgi:hypothetical protein
MPIVRASLGVTSVNSRAVCAEAIAVARIKNITIIAFLFIYLLLSFQDLGFR